jgi:protein-S-isoprenylcysteine O-methyltransferase Ste14
LAGEVDDLVRKLEEGKLSSQEVLEELKRRRLLHHQNEPFSGFYSVLGLTAWGVLCSLPVLAEIFGLDIANVPSIEMPVEVGYLASILLVVLVLPLFYSVYLRSKNSVTGDEDIILVKDGAYGIVRHPSFLAGLMIVIILPIIFASKIPFTLFTVLGVIAVFVALYLQSLSEEKVNIRKWGDEYRRYTEEVPRFNFILGLWRRTRKDEEKPEE